MTRGDCKNRPRPCTNIRCRYHLAVDGGTTTTCALDVADEGEHTLREIAEVMNCSYEQVRKIQIAAMRSFKERLDIDDVSELGRESCGLAAAIERCVSPPNFSASESAQRKAYKPPDTPDSDGSFGTLGKWARRPRCDVKRWQQSHWERLRAARYWAGGG